MPIYSDSSRIINQDDVYQKMFEDREVGFIEHYRTKRFPVGFRTVSVRTQKHVWRKTDKFYKLSGQFYGAYEYWWVIAYFNGKPTDGHCKVGDVLEIPLQLNKVLEALGEL